MSLPRRHKEKKRRKKPMPIVQREPTIVKREIRLEQPVNELLDDYARFIESMVKATSGTLSAPARRNACLTG
jgi:hypothetical protein